MTPELNQYTPDSWLAEQADEEVRFNRQVRRHLFSRSEQAIRQDIAEGCPDKAEHALGQYCGDCGMIFRSSDLPRKVTTVAEKPAEPRERMTHCPDCHRIAAKCLCWYFKR